MGYEKRYGHVDENGNDGCPCEKADQHKAGANELGKKHQVERQAGADANGIGEL